VTLIRHTTPDVTPGTCYGRTDLALAASFEDELSDVLERMPSGSVLLSSPLQRCRILAERLSAEVQQEVCALDHWIEMDFGAWEGVPWADIPRPDLDAWAADFMQYAGHAGESVAMLETRVRTALSETPENAIVVTHSGCIRAACAIRGLHDGWDTETPFGGMVTLP
jgi:alpha-ribazole phosphatase